MDIRIDSVFSLNPKEVGDDVTTNMPKKSELLGDKYCVVSVERIDIGTKKSVSYRKWMKTHSNCGNNCLESEGDKRSRVADSAQEEETSYKRVTRSSRKRENDTNSSVIEPIAKKKKLSHEEELKESIETRGDKTDINQDKDNKAAVCDEVLQAIESKIKKEPTDTNYESSETTLKKPIKEVRSHSKVKIKTEKPDEDSFKLVCEELARAPVDERASYIEKLRSILNAEEATKSKIQPEPNNMPTAPKIMPSQTSDSKTLAALQLVMIDGKSYVIPTNSLNQTNLTSSCNQTGLASSFNQTGLTSSFNQPSLISSFNQPSLTSSVNQTGSPASALKNVGRERNNESPSVPLPSPSTPVSRQSVANIVSLPIQGSIQSSVKSTIPNALPNINNSLVMSQSSKSTSVLSSNVNTVTSVPSSEKRPSDTSEKKEIHGHLVTHPDGKQYFVPLGGGQTFPNKPLIQLEPLQVKSSSSSALPLSMVICSSSQNAFQNSSSSLPILSRSDETCKTSSSSVLNNKGASLENKKGQNMIPKTVHENLPVKDVSTDLNKLIAPTLLPKNVSVPTSTVTNLVYTASSATKTSNSPKNSGKETFVQIQSKSATPTSAKTSSVMQTNPTANSNANACGQMLIPLMMNGVVQNVLMNIMPNGTLTLPSQDKTVVTSEIANKTNTKQDLILPINNAQNGVASANGLQNVSSFVSPAQHIPLGGLQASQQAFSLNQLNSSPILTLNTGQLTNQIVSPGSMVTQNMPILNPVLPVGQILSNPVQGAPLGSKGNPIEISTSTNRNVTQSSNTLPVQQGNVLPQTNSSSQLLILPSAQILSPGVPMQNALNQNEKVPQTKPSTVNQVLSSSHPIPLVQRNIQFLSADTQTGNIQTGINQPQFKLQPSVVDTKHVGPVTANIDQPMTIFLQPDTSKKPGAMYQQPSAPVVPTPQQNIVLNQLKQQGFNVGIVHQSPSFPNNVQQLVMKNSDNNEMIKGNSTNPLVTGQSIFNAPGTLGPVSKVLSNLASKSQTSIETNSDNHQSINSKEVKGSSDIHSLKTSVSASSIRDSNKTMPEKRIRSYSPSELCKQVTKSKDYKKQIEENAVKEPPGGVIPMFLKTSTGQILPFSAVKPNYETNAGNLVTSLLTTNSSTAATENNSFVSETSTPTILHDSQNSQMRSNLRPENPPVVPQTNSNNHDPSNVLLIPAQGYTKSSSSSYGQLSQSITQSHPLLQQSLRTSNANGTAGNSSVVTPTATIDQSKRNKRKPQVVVHIDKEYPDLQENTSQSPEQDYSIFMVPSVSSSSTTKSIVEKGLRIPDSMLQELQKKQLSMESTVQKLKQNKFYSSDGQP